jgi:hypothetical protein
MAADRFYLKQHDLSPALKVRLLDDTTPVDLTNAVAVQLLMRSRRTGLKVDAPMTVAPQNDPDTLGVVSYSWQPGDTDTPGDFQTEIQVTWPLGKPQTFPARGHITTVIEKDLGGPGTPLV